MITVVYMATKFEIKFKFSSCLKSLKNLCVKSIKTQKALKLVSGRAI